MRITIEALGSLRSYLPEGESSTVIDLPEGRTLADALNSIGVPASAQWNAAIEGQLVNAGHVLSDGDRLLLFSPIAGGCCH